MVKTERGDRQEKSVYPKKETTSITRTLI